MKKNQLKFCLITLGLVISQNLFAQNKLMLTNEIYYASNDTSYVLQSIGDEDVLNYFYKSPCNNQFKILALKSAFKLDSFFKQEIPIVGILINERFILYNYGKNNIDYGPLKKSLLFMGEVLPINPEICKKEKEESIIIGISSFLKKNGYPVKIQKKIDNNLKKAMVSYLKENGIPIHTITNQIENTFEVNNDEIEKEYCNCINKLLAKK